MSLAIYENPIRPRPPLAFESGMKMKIAVADKTASLLFLTATVTAVKDHHLRVSIDGKPDHRSYWLRIPTREPRAPWRRIESSRRASDTSSAPPPPTDMTLTPPDPVRPLITPESAKPPTLPAPARPLTTLPPAGPLTPPVPARPPTTGVSNHASEKLFKHLESLALPHNPNLWTQSDVSALVMRIAGTSAGIAVAAARMSGPELLMASREELVECLHLRLGPVIKLYSAIRHLREYSLKSIRDK